MLLRTCLQVVAKSEGDWATPKKQAIVEVMVDLLLDSEGITVHKGLVYVAESLDGYPVSVVRV